MSPLFSPARRPLIVIVLLVAGAAGCHQSRPSRTVIVEEPRPYYGHPRGYYAPVPPPPPYRGGPYRR